MDKRVDTLLDLYDRNPTSVLPVLAMWSSLRKALQTAESAKPAPVLKFNDQQQMAWDKIVAWLKTDDQFFTLKGVAGSGKSFMMSRIATLDYNFHFSAPVNKATKVLSEFLGTEVKTTFSLLGLRMTQDEEEMTLTQGPAPELGHNPILVIDEAGMIPEIITNILVRSNYRVLLVGDPAQHFPVKENRSPAWSLATKENRAMLTKVERFDNQLLALSVAIRNCVKNKDYTSPIVNNNDGKEGVFVMTRKRMMEKIYSLSLQDWQTTKVCCWRNDTVDSYNANIRARLGFTEDYVVGEPILLASPVIVNSSICGYIDEELIITAITERSLSLEEGDLQVYQMSVADRSWTLNVPVQPHEFSALLSKRASFASSLSGIARKKAWSKFWELKNRCHNIRYGFALTSHRLQGTTVDHIYVDQSDILANGNKPSAFRGLYVAATRPRISLTTF